MAKILDVQEFISDQTQLHKERRVSQYIYFLDKTPSFPIYYAINKTVSTTELVTGTIDEYIGLDSPIRFDKIKNLPLYGIQEITSESEFDDLLGTNSEGYIGEAIVVPGVLEPSEGDCFIITYFNRNVLFVINSVTEITLKSRPHFKVQFHVESADKISQLNRQVISNNTAIFDNIGTENRVILKDDVYDTTRVLRGIYKDIHTFYIKKFMKSNTTTFETKIDIGDMRVRFMDKFLEMFMTDNRVLVMDNIMKTIFMLDNNQMYDSGDYDTYETSIFYAIRNKTMDLVKPTTHVNLYVLNNPFALFKLQTNDNLYISTTYSNMDDAVYNPALSVEFDMTPLITKINANDTNVVSEVDKLYNVLVNYFNGGELSVSDFTDLMFVNVSDLYKYYLIPPIMYILYLNISILEKDIVNTYKLTPNM